MLTRLANSHVPHLEIDPGLKHHAFYVKLAEVLTVGIIRSFRPCA